MSRMHAHAGSECGFILAAVVCRKQLNARMMHPSAAVVQRWVFLHGQEVALDHQHATLLCEAPPQQLTLSYQHVHMQALMQTRHAKRIRSCWSRMLFSLREMSKRRARRQVLGDVAALRFAARSHFSAARCDPSSPHTGGDFGSFVPDPSEELVLAAELGLDLATYRMLRQLEQRDILPEDYDLLGRLDEAVKPKTLDVDDLNRFEIKTYAPPMLLPNEPCLLDHCIDYWRLPLPVLVDEERDANLSIPRCPMDFWRLPMIALDDRDGASTTTFVGDTASSMCSMDLCGVCLVDFDHGDEMRVLPCGHYFHRDCIDHWLLNSSTVCPVDKRDLRMIN